MSEFEKFPKREEAESSGEYVTLVWIWANKFAAQLEAEIIRLKLESEKANDSILKRIFESAARKLEEILGSFK